MRFDGIQMKGKFHIQKVTTLPPYTTADEARMVYDTTGKKLYIGTDTSWSEAGGGGGYGLPVTNFTDNGILEPGKMYFVNTSSGSLSGNLVANPKLGDTITIVDVAGTFNMYSFTIKGNGKNIHIDTSLEADVKDVILILVYTGVSWKIDVGGIVSGSGNGSFTVEYNSNFTASSGMLAFVDTRDNIVTVTLPDESELNTGAIVTIYDQYSTFSVNKCRVISLHAEFENGTSAIDLTNDGSKVVLIWDAGSQQWKMTQSDGFKLGNIVYIKNNYDSHVDDFVFVDTTLNPINITLPPSGEIGSKGVISIYDQMSNFKTNNVTIIPTFGTVNGQTTYIVKDNGIRVDFIWDNQQDDWKVDIGGDISSVLGSGGMGGSNPVSVSNNTVANIGDFLFVDSTNNTVTITLPSVNNLESGEGISVYDTKGKFGLNNVTINPQNSTISGDTTFICDINNLRVDFFYNKIENDWKIDIGGALVSGSASASVYGSASTTAFGLIRLSTSAEAIAGTNNSKAITPEALQAKLVSHGLI